MKKLVLKKETIVNLGEEGMNDLKGGTGIQLSFLMVCTNPNKCSIIGTCPKTTIPTPEPEPEPDEPDEPECGDCPTRLQTCPGPNQYGVCG